MKQKRRRSNTVECIMRLWMTTRKHRTLILRTRTKLRRKRATRYSAMMSEVQQLSTIKDKINIYQASPSRYSTFSCRSDTVIQVDQYSFKAGKTKLEVKLYTLGPNVLCCMVQSQIQLVTQFDAPGYELRLQLLQGQMLQGTRSDTIIEGKSSASSYKSKIFQFEQKYFLMLQDCD